MPNILINTLSFTLDPLGYFTIVADMVTYNLTAINYIENHHTTISDILSGRLILMCALNNGGVPSITFWAIFPIPL